MEQDTTTDRPSPSTRTGGDPSGSAPSAPLRAAVVVRGLAVGAVAMALVAVLLPRAAGTTWSGIGEVLARVTPAQVTLLGALWVAGLYAQSFVLTSALPGLTHRRAMMLNLTGSSVSNVLPLGGAVGIGLNWAMIRSWGFSGTAFGLYTLLTNVWDVAAKLCLPALALVVLAASGGAGGPTLSAAAAVAVGVLALLAGTVTAGIVRPGVAAGAGRVLERVAQFGLRLVGSRRRVDVVGPLLQARERSGGLVRTAWRGLTLGVAAYVTMLFVLLVACLRVLGSGLPLTAVLAGFALERTLTLAVVTPAGAGLAETGAVALMVALGGEPATVAAAVLLYRGLVLGTEVPVGAAWTLAWFALRRRQVGTRPVAGPHPHGP